MLAKHSCWYVPAREESVSYFPKDQNTKTGKSLHRATLLSRLRQAPGELIADIPHFKHLPYVPGKHSHPTITFCFSFPGLCFALNKNSRKTQAYVTRYAPLPRNSSVTFLEFHLCKQSAPRMSAGCTAWKTLFEFQASEVFGNISQAQMPVKSSSFLFFKSYVCDSVALSLF